MIFWKQRALSSLKYWKLSEAKRRNIDGLELRVKRFMQEQKRNFIMVIVGASEGKTGTGKSYTAMKIGENFSKMMGTDFSEQNIFFSGAEFIRAINGEAKPYTVYVADEVGVWLGAKTWYSFQNRVMSWLSQTFRKKRYLTIFTLPSLRFLDSDQRQMMHMLLEMIYVDHQKHMAYFKPKVVVSSSTKREEPIEQYPITFLPTGIAKITAVGRGMPAKELIERYEAKKEEWMKEKYNEMEAIVRSQSKLDFKVMSERAKEQKLMEMAKKILSRQELFGKQSRQKFVVNKNSIKTFFDISDGEASLLKRFVEMQINRTGDAEDLLKKIKL